MKEASDKPLPDVKRQRPALAAALLIGVVVGLPLVAALYVASKLRKG